MLPGLGWKELEGSPPRLDLEAEIESFGGTSRLPCEALQLSLVEQLMTGWAAQSAGREARAALRAMPHLAAGSTDGDEGRGAFPTWNGPSISNS